MGTTKESGDLTTKNRVGRVPKSELTARMHQGSGSGGDDWTKPGSIYSSFYADTAKQFDETAPKSKERKELGTFLENTFRPAYELKNRKTGQIDQHPAFIAGLGNEEFQNRLADYELGMQAQFKQSGQKHHLYNVKAGTGHVSSRMRTVSKGMDAKNDEALGNSGLLG